MAEHALDHRKGAILRAVVAHYVRSGEPVGSKTIVERFRLGVSPATVRNEMAALEDLGYIFQPHTSAGRIPTDAGYRYFVDAWAQRASLPASEAEHVERFFTEPRWELEDALRETASLLSALTHHAAVVFAPALDRGAVCKVELVRLSTDRTMVLFVTETGQVRNFIAPIDEALDDAALQALGESLNEVVSGASLDDAARRILDALASFREEHRAAARLVARAMAEELANHDVDRVFLEGASNIVDEQNFSDLETVRQVIGALEHRRVVLEVLADALSCDSVSVRIGTENPVEEMRYCSVVTAPYGWHEAPLGSLGIVGPTRMDYARSIAAVDEVARALGHMLKAVGL